MAVVNGDGSLRALVEKRQAPPSNPALVGLDDLLEANRAVLDEFFVSGDSQIQL